MTEYGVLSEIVSGAGSLVAASAAIGLSWKGRTQWEPSEQDVPKGAQKVGGLFTAVTIAGIWFGLRDPTHLRLVTGLAIGLGVGCIVFLLIYGLFIAVLTYELVYAVNPQQTTSRKIIGGFWLTTAAKRAIRQHSITIQELFKGAAYDPDRVWPRLGRALSKMCFVICYLGLTVTGSIALTCASILIGNAIATPAK